MKGIISSHSALNAYQRQSAVDPVSVKESPVPSESTASSTGIRAARVSISAEARALAEGDASVDRAKVDRLRQTLQSGRLKFDSQLIAQRLVDQGE
jgi:flagellar biosynthesis anti-sigma factor FlgM